MFGRGPMFPGMPGNDPFGQGHDPFAHVDNMMRSMMANPFGPMMGFGYMGFPQAAAPAHGSRMPEPVVEEVGDDGYSHSRKASSEPIVEEPDDEPRYNAGGSTHHHQSHPRAAAPNPYTMHTTPHGYNQAGGFNQAGIGGFPGFGMNSGSGFVSYSSSSSFTQTGGPNGVTYSSTTTSRMGPDGVRETQQTVRDGRRGVEAITVSRGLNNKSRTVKRVRDASGREVTEQHLEGLNEQDASHFDEEWRREAEQKLPAWGMAPQRVTDSHGRRHQPSLALPDSAGAGTGTRRSNSRGYHGSGSGHYM